MALGQGARASIAARMQPSEVELEAARLGETVHKLIFLDIDGVLNGWGSLSIDLALATRLLAVVRATGAEIVLSSMWRLKRRNRRRVRAAFLEVGLPRPLNYTPRMNGGRARAAEILAWLRINTVNVLQKEDIDFPVLQDDDEFNEAHYKLPVAILVSHYCVLDDLDLTAEARGDPDGLLRHHIVRTPALHGITEHNVEQALAVLTRAKTEPLPLNTRCDECGAVATVPLAVRATPLNKTFCQRQCETHFTLRYAALRATDFEKG